MEFLGYAIINSMRIRKNKKIRKVTKKLQRTFKPTEISVAIPQKFQGKLQRDSKGS